MGAVHIRTLRGSPDFGRWHGETLSAEHDGAYFVDLTELDPGEAVAPALLTALGQREQRKS